METHVVWYKDAATLIALVALVVSLISSAISTWHTRNQDMQSAHLDLRSVLQRLLSVSLENRERIAKYKEQIVLHTGDAESVAYLRESIEFVNVLARQEMNVLASQGAKSVRLLGPKVVASPEYLTIARAQAEAGDFESQGEFIRLACDTAKTPSDRLGSLRDSATYLFTLGRVNEGRKEFAAQVEILKNLPHYAPAFVASANVELQLAWMAMEASVGDMNAAQEHVNAAVETANNVGPGEFQNALRAQIDTAITGLQKGVVGGGPGAAKTDAPS
jgi:hypothetical protein